MESRMNQICKSLGKGTHPKKIARTVVAKVYDQTCNQYLENLQVDLNWVFSNTYHTESAWSEEIEALASIREFR
jgi:hypothetical protein